MSRATTTRRRRRAAAEDCAESAVVGHPSSESVVERSSTAAPWNDSDPHQQAEETNPNSTNPNNINTPTNTNNTTTFVTPSDLVRRLNATLSEQFNTTTSDSDNTTPNPKLFELHKRLPDGSAVPANASEVQSYDFQAKLQQAASQLAVLPTLDQKLAWAERQRQRGNDCYRHGDFAAAIDAYLTCLLTAVVPSQRGAGPPTPQHPDEPSDGRARQWLLWAKILHNLALATLQLEWYHKTIQFCTLGLQTLAEQPPEDDDDDESLARRLLDAHKSKLHYARAKASRLRGEYDQAVADLDASEQWLRLPITRSNNNTADNNNNTEVLRQNIQQERRRLQRAQVQAQRHAQQQKQALQQLWGPRSNHHDDDDNDNNNQPPSSNAGAAAAPGVPSKPLLVPLLYQDKYPKSRSHPPPRPYSTLRAPMEKEDAEEDDDRVPVASTFNYYGYWQWYLERLGRGAQRLLDWLDDAPGTTASERRHKQD